MSSLDYYSKIYNNKDFQKKFSKFLEEPIMKKRNNMENMSSYDQRKLIYDMVRKMQEYFPNYGSAYNNIHKNINGVKNIENLLISTWMGTLNLSIGGAMAIQYISGNVIVNCASEEQKTKYKKEIENYSKIYALCATEIGHGANLKDLKCKVNLNSNTNKMVLNCEDIKSYKCWPGNLLSADVIIVLAKLFIDNEDNGICWFRVELDKKDNGKSYKLRDIGNKLGYYGVENGLISFHNMEIPIDSLLSGFCKLEYKNKKYILKSDLPKEKLFIAHLKSFPDERLGIASMAIGGAMQSVNIALQYSKYRKQFRIENNSKFENSIIDYNMQKRFLCEEVSKIIALKIGFSNMLSINDDSKSISYKHSIYSVLKYLCTELSWEASCKSRFLTGGNGTALFAKVGSIMADIDLFRTFGGSNTLMILETTKYNIYSVKNWNIFSKIFGPISPFCLRNLNLYNRVCTLDLINSINKLYKYKKDVESLKFAKIMMNLSRKQKIEYYGNNGYDLYLYGKLCSMSILIDNCYEFLKNDSVSDSLLYTFVYFCLNQLKLDSAWFLNNGLLSNWVYNNLDNKMNYLSNYLTEYESIGNDYTLLDNALNINNESIVKDSVLCHKNYHEKFYEMTIPYVRK